MWRNYHQQYWLVLHWSHYHVIILVYMIGLQLLDDQNAMHERKDSSGQEIQQSRVQRSEQTVCIKYIKKV